MMGADSQEIGDWGEAQVQAALTGFVVNDFRRDVGEDLLVELGGRAVATAGSPPPRQAYVQVKAHRQSSDGDGFSERIERKHLQRWAFQRLPVFVVTAIGFPGDPRFFLRSIDDYLQATPDALDPDRNQQVFSVRTSFAPVLSVALKEQIEQFYRTDVPNLADLDQADLANAHLEFMSEREDLYPHALARLDNWGCIFKSEPRPGNLRAVVDFIAARARDRVGNGERPAQVTCFLYRSQAAMNSGQWATRIVWSEKTHHAAPSSWLDQPAIAVTPRPGAVEVQRYITSQTASQAEFQGYLHRLALRTDRLAQKLLGAPPSSRWTSEDVTQLRSLEAEWDRGPFAPNALQHVSDFFGSFLYTLEAHRRTVRGRFDATKATRGRWQQQELEKIQGFCGATTLLLDQATKK